jgi:hypothetical protein
VIHFAEGINSKEGAIPEAQGGSGLELRVCRLLTQASFHQGDYVFQCLVLRVLGKRRLSSQGPGQPRKKSVSQWLPKPEW